MFNESDSFKKYIKENDVLCDVVSFNKFVKELEKTVVPESYQNYDKKVKLCQTPKGLITLESIFNRNNFINFGQPVNNLKDFLINYGSWLVVDDKSDNTFNYNEGVESPIEYEKITLQNEFNNRHVDVVLFSACTALDVRGGYTDSCIIVFDNEENNHYELCTWLNSYYKLVNGSFTIEDVKYEFNVKGELVDNYQPIYITNNKDVNIDNAINADLTDKNELRDEISDLLSADTDQLKGCAISNLKINYVSDPEL